MNKTIKEDSIIEVGFYEGEDDKVKTCPEGCKTCSNNTFCKTCFDGFFLDFQSKNQYICSKCKNCLSCSYGNSKIHIDIEFYKNNSFESRSHFVDFIKSNIIKEICITCQIGKFLNSIFECKKCIEIIPNCKLCSIGSPNRMIKSYQDYKDLQLNLLNSTEIEKFFQTNDFSLRCNECYSSSANLKKNFDLKSCISCGSNCQKCEWMYSNFTYANHFLPLKFNLNLFLKCIECKNENGFNFDGKNCFNCLLKTNDQNCISCAYYSKDKIYDKFNHFFKFKNENNLKIKCISCRNSFFLNSKGK